MVFTCDVEVYDEQIDTSFRFVADPESDALFGLSATIAVRGGQPHPIHVNDLGLEGEYIRALVQLGSDFIVPRVGIFVPLTGDELPTIGRWQTAFEETGLSSELRGTTPRQGRKLIERASQAGIYATQPRIGSYTKPSQLLNAHPARLVRRTFTR